MEYSSINFYKISALYVLKQRSNCIIMYRFNKVLKSTVGLMNDKKSIQITLAFEVYFIN